jgi:hypothetical protein
MQLDRFSFAKEILDGNTESIFELFKELAEYEVIETSKMTARHEAIDDAINISPILREWQEARSIYGDSPCYSRYQKEYLEFEYPDYSSLNNEIDEIGLLLPPEQILFRGAITGENGFDWNRPLSTTLHPRIAAYHAFKHWKQTLSRPHVTLSALVLPSQKEIHAIIGPFGEELDFGHEYEVLINFNQAPSHFVIHEFDGFSCKIFSW